MQVKMRVLVCDGRQYNDVAAVGEVLHTLFKEFKPEELVIIHGDATGADQLAKFFATSHGITQIPYPAMWKKYGKRAGPICNQQMFDEGMPDRVIAFPGDSGTEDMVNRAKGMNLPVWRPYG